MLIDFLIRAWRPAVEILFLAVGIYYVFTFVKGTRGGAIVTGFLVAMLSLAFVAKIFDLAVLQWLLGSITTFFVIAVIVIFQPEIRRMLAQLGNLQVFANSREQREAIEIIVQTVERLADVKIGALIAIEQSIHLRGAVEAGIEVDCVATPEMLETIFFPNNAIHDGGVIIRGDRITHAACIFPLSRRPDLNKSLGTRHRAAIGLSEETDAIIVVVSEETGWISYAYGGQLTRGITLENLRSSLSSVLVKPDKPRGAAEWIRAAFSPRSNAPQEAAAAPVIPAPAPATAPRNLNANGGN
jgi:diadenylate cyclase